MSSPLSRRKFLGNAGAAAALPGWPHAVWRKFAQRGLGFDWRGRFSCGA